MNTEEEILRKLDELVKLTAAQVISGKTFKEKVVILSSTGMRPNEIARLLNKTSNHVRVTLSQIRKEDRGE